MAATEGIRDGAFVKFAGWDVDGNDQAYFPKLRGDINQLKQTVLEKQGTAFYAFNSNGWIKSWSVLDYSKFVRVSGADLYVRVEYPGWHFVQGQDSVGNDIKQITDVSTATGLKETIIAFYQGDNKVAAFNTQGWVKHKVNYPLTFGPRPGTPGSLDGIYIRTKFESYSFFPQVDSPGNDIKETPEAKDDVPALIRISQSLSNGSGFNTLGWHKSDLDIPPTATDPYISEPWQGTYTRVCWPDFVHLPGLDSPYNDIRQTTVKQVREILEAARQDPTCVAVNTDGWLKRDLVDEPRDFPGAENLKGIYVKILNPPRTKMGSELATMAIDDNTMLKTAFFSLKGTVIIWCRWILKDSSVRAAYSQSVAYATREISQQVSSGSLTPAAAAQQAHEMRNNFLIGMRDKTSPPGLLVARAIKPAGGSYQHYLDRNANRTYGKNFAELTPDQAKTVSISTIESAGRANPQITNLMKTAGKVSKSVMVIAAAVSVYSVATAQDWETELGRQVFSWSGSIAAGELGVGVGTLVAGPIGAIVGAIVGGILGGLGADALATWFFGGSSSRMAVELLGQALKPTSELVEKKISASSCKYYVHYLRAVHVSVLSSRSVSEAAYIVEEMVNDIPTDVSPKGADIGSDNEVLATIVWIKSPGDTLPGNAANPRDLITLMNFVTKNLPAW